MQMGRPLIEVGSNLFELIEFAVTKPKPGEEGQIKLNAHPSTFGVNVAKVREVIRLPQIIPCITNCPEVLGVFNLRGIPVPVIHLAKALGYGDEPLGPSSQIIVTEFARRVAGFVVAETRRIRRVSWDKVLPPSSQAFNSITGMMLIENNDFLFIIDFERILMEIEGRVAPQSQGGDNYVAERRQEASPSRQESVESRPAPASGGPLVMVVDDSATARKAICDMLRGLDLNVVEYANGELAWNALKDKVDGPIQLVISDVEMPQLDGYSLVKRVREDSELKAMPIILHSSLSGTVSNERAMSAGANAYVTKFNRRGIVDALRSVLPAGTFKEAS